MTVEDAITNIHTYGLKVNNLFELEDGRWQANLRRRQECFEFGHGKTPAQALERAFLKFEESKSAPLKKRRADIEDLL